MARLLRRFLLLALLSASVAAAVRALRVRRTAPTGANDAPSWPAVVAATEPVLAPMDPTVARPVAGLQADPDAGPGAGAAWVGPVEGRCPDGYPVKANQSGIYHVTGGQFYDRTVPQRCYATPQDAEADGYRAARR